MKSKVVSFVLSASVALGVAFAYGDAHGISDQTSTAGETAAVDTDAAAGPDGGHLFLATDEQYVQAFGAAKASQHGLAYRAVKETDSPADSAGADAEAVAYTTASSRWNAVKFVSRDADGRNIPIREGNSTFGWVHFSGPHNIHSSKVIDAAVSENPESGSTKTRKVYGAVLYDNLGIILARVKVVAQYDWQTSDHRYQLANRSDKIGVITAYCQGVSRCPDALNRV